MRTWSAEAHVGVRVAAHVEAVRVREHRLVWLGGLEDTARRYPRVGLVVPYRFALAATPLDASRTAAERPTGSGLVLLWPGSHGPDLGDRERQGLESGARRLAGVLRRAADEGRAIRPEAHPVILAPRPPPTPGPVEAAAGLGFIRRLPGAAAPST